jgi:DME family drug/metabolite transporter
MGIGALVLLLLCWYSLRRRMWQIKRRDALLMAFLGGMQAIFQYTYLAAIPLCGITIATLIALCVAPVIVVIYSAIFLRERVTVLIGTALFCALLGTVLLTITPSDAHYANVLGGALLSLVCATCYAAVILGGRALSGRYHPLQVNAASFGLGALLLLCCSCTSFAAHIVLAYQLNAWLLLIYLGCIPTALAYVLFQGGMRSTPATLTSILTLAEPLTAAILAWLLFGEQLSLAGILGAVLLLGTIFLLAKRA